MSALGIVPDRPRLCAMRLILLAAAIATSFATVSCKAVKAERAPAAQASTALLFDTATSAHVIRVYVSAVNCEMNVEDAARLNVIARTPGLSMEVVFTGIADSDTLVLTKAARDLGLSVRARLPWAQELEQFKSIGGVRLPMALVVKAKQLKTFIAGESMPRTVSLLEASMSPTGGQ